MGWGRGATLLASVGPSGMRGGVGRIWEHQTLRNLFPPPPPFSLWEPPLHKGNGISRGKAVQGLS